MPLSYFSARMPRVAVIFSVAKLMLCVFAGEGETGSVFFRAAELSKR